MIDWQDGSQHGPAVTHRLRTCPGIFLFFAIIPFTTLVNANLVISVCPICCRAVSKQLDIVWGRSLNLPTTTDELWEQNQALHELELGENTAEIKPGVQAPWLFPQWFLYGMSHSCCSGWLKQSAGREKGRWKNLRVINLKGLRLPAQSRQKPQNPEELEEWGRALLRDLGGDIAHIPGRSFAQVCSFRLCLLPCALHCRGWRKQAYKNTRKNTLECTVSLRAFGIRSAVAFEPALWYDEISSGIT